MNLGIINKKMKFLDFSGNFRKLSSSSYKFYFKNGLEENSKPLFIVPPIYDIPFKKVFSSKKIGLESARNFLNSLLFPNSKSIIELKCIEKEIKSNSHIKNDEGTLILDNAYIAKINYYDKEKEILHKKEVLIDFEMESNYQIDKYTCKFFNYATGLRNQNDFRETWVIALCLNKSKKPRGKKSSNSYMTKKYKFNGNINLDYVQIYEIYLNDLFDQLDDNISVIEGEEIKDIGKEWIKLFTLELWGKIYKESLYCIPSNLKFEGTYIENAIKLLSDISGELSFKISVEQHHQKQQEEEIENRLNQKYQEGIQEGIQAGIQEGLQEGIKEGILEGIQKGRNHANLNILDNYFNMHKYGEELGKIILVDKISFSVLKERYGDSPNLESFYKLLLAQDWIIN